jgi:hypothetical protein
MCGANLKSFKKNWIYSTGCVGLTCRFTYNKKSNSIQVHLKQENIAKKTYMKERINWKIVKDQEKVFLEKQKSRLELEDKTEEKKEESKKMEENESDEEKDECLFVDYKRKSLRWFTGNITMLTHETNGTQFKDNQHTLKLSYGKTILKSNLPLLTKVKKVMKKKDNTATGSL